MKDISVSDFITINLSLVLTFTGSFTQVTTSKLTI